MQTKTKLCFINSEKSFLRSLLVPPRMKCWMLSSACIPAASLSWVLLGPCVYTKMVSIMPESKSFCCTLVHPRPCRRMDSRSQCDFIVVYSVSIMRWKPTILFWICIRLTKYAKQNSSEVLGLRSLTISLEINGLTNVGEPLNRKSLFWIVGSILDWQGWVRYDLTVFSFWAT